MANQKHLDILRQGVKVWNQWREEHPDIQPDLTFSNYPKEDLAGANLSRALFSWADLYGVNLNGADLSYAQFGSASLLYAKLESANLYNAFLEKANLTDAYLRGAVLREAELWNANFTRTDLGRVDFSRAYMGGTIFGNVSLNFAKGLETVQHSGPSTIGIDTIYRSQGKIPEVFLRGAGVQDSFIKNIHTLIGQASNYYSCFISYSTKDETFVNRLHDNLQNLGVRCWYALEDMKTGDKIRQRLVDAIRLQEKFLLVLSEHSVESEWVETEVETALEVEREYHKLLLFPIRIDDAVKRTTKAWAGDVRRRHICDFRQWQNPDDYGRSLNRLLRDLIIEVPVASA